jgi:hypothetical protein
MPEYHTHPMPVEVYGTRLVAGDVIKEGDIFASSTGRWEKAPPCHFGFKLQEGCRAYWVRPEYRKI